MHLENYERPPSLRGVHFGPGTSAGFDIPWWVQFLKSMHISLVKIVDDAGSMMEFAAACRAAGIMPIVRLYRQYPYPGQVRAKDWLALKEYLRRGITRWFEIGNELNLWDPEWHPDYRPQWKEGDPAVYDTPWFANTALPLMMDPWVVDAEYIISLGGYPAFPALAQCGFHPVCGSIPIARAMFNYLKDHYFERAKAIWLNGGWLAVHDATLNHFYHDGQKWHFEYPYDPSCQARHPGKTIMEDDNSLIGHEGPRDMITSRWGLRVPIISTEGGVFLDVGTQWDSNYPGISSAEYHGQATLGMFDWLDEYQKTHEWFFGMCPWIVAGQVLGHPIHWEAESWKKVDREEPVVRYLQGSPPRRLNVVAPEPPPGPTPPPEPPLPPEPPSPPTPEGFPRPPGDNGMGIHLGLGDQLVGAALDEDIARAKALRFTWATVAFGAGEDVMVAAAKKLYAAGIMPVVRKVLGNIDGKYDFARDTRLLLSNGIPAYIQIFNEPSDGREWEKERPTDYMQRWAGLWAQKASEVVAAGGHPGIQCLHPPELFALFATLPRDSHIWKQAWFCSHNYGLNHPPSWKGDYWSVLGWETFADMFQDFLGFVPPIICGEGGWLYKASDDARYPMVDDLLHSAYHAEMFRWFESGHLSDGQQLPDYLFAVCPWLLSGPSDEAWYGYTTRTKTIEAVQNIPPFVRGGASMPTPEPQPQPQPEPTPVSPVEYVGLAQWMKEELVIEPALNLKQPHWRVKKVEVQPGTDNFSAFAIADKSQGATTALFFWADGEVMAEFKADAYTIPEARQWAASMPMFNLWGSYGVTMLGDLGNSEVVRGLGLYQKEGDQIMKKTGHHPVLVYFERVEGTPEPEPEPEPEPPPQPEPPPPPKPEPVLEKPYTLEARLGQVPFEDLRAEIRKFSNVKALDATARRDAQGNPLFHLIEFIVIHHSGYDKAHTPMSTAKQAVAEGEPTIEYHFCIQEGKLFWTAPLVWVTNQTYQFNSRSIGVCVLGDYEFKDPDPRDLETLRFFIAAFEEFMGQGWGKSRPVGLVPHRYVVKNATACPGRIWPAVLDGLRPKLEVPSK